VAITIDDIYLRDGGLCGICGEPVKLKQASVDHIIPRSKGGKDCLHNTQTTHWNCNRIKRARMPEVVPEPCDCPEPIAEPEPDDRDSRPALSRVPPPPREDIPPTEPEWKHPGSPKNMTIRFGMLSKTVDETHAGSWELTFPDGRIWMFEMTTAELNRLLGEIHAVHAYVAVKMLDGSFDVV
jgi:hypothetical protein